MNTGVFHERLYRRAGGRDRLLYYCAQGYSETDCEAVWGEQEYHTYGDNNIERFWWRIG